MSYPYHDSLQPDWIRNRHVHVSLVAADKKNVFAVSEAELKAGGRKGAAYDDTKFLSQEGEWFLAGVLDGLPDGAFLSVNR
jgi:glutamine synthetase